MGAGLNFENRCNEPPLNSAEISEGGLSPNPPTDAPLIGLAAPSNSTISM